MLCFTFFLRLSVTTLQIISKHFGFKQLENVHVFGDDWAIFHVTWSPLGLYDWKFFIKWSYSMTHRSYWSPFKTSGKVLNEGLQYPWFYSLPPPCVLLRTKKHSNFISKEKFWKERSESCQSSYVLDIITGCIKSNSLK